MMTRIPLLLAAMALCAGSASAADAAPDWWFTPFWEGPATHGESLFFIQGPEGRPTAPLLFHASKVLRVEQPSTGLVYEQGKDYVLSADGNALSLPEGSRIAFKKIAEMYPELGAPQSIKQRRDAKTALFFSEGHVYHDLQVEVSYERAAGEWKTRGGFIPASMGKQLPHTLGKLKQKQVLTLALLGDSISAGANASAMVGARPNMPPYGQLVADGLHARYGSAVTFKNFAVGGTATKWGTTEIGKVAAIKPDLIIIAFGMNDASGHVEPDAYAANIKTMIEKTRAANPEAEFVLVATMEGNLEWSGASEQHYLDYREKLMAMGSEKGVVIADMTSMWRDLLKRKKFADITGNGVNHPNDFGHRTYAQIILTLIQ